MKIYRILRENHSINRNHRIPLENNENYENHGIPIDNHEYHETLKIPARITKIMKIWISRENHENHENLKIAYENHANHNNSKIWTWESRKSCKSWIFFLANNTNQENHGISCEIIENHEIPRNPLENY